MFELTFKANVKLESRNKQTKKFNTIGRELYIKLTNDTSNSPYESVGGWHKDE